MEFTVSVNCGADMVGLLNVSFDGGSSQVSGRDGRQGRGGVD